MSNLSLMTRSEMKRHIEQLGVSSPFRLKRVLIPSLRFGNDSLFEDEVYSPITDSSSYDKLVLSNLLNEKRKEKSLF